MIGEIKARDRERWIGREREEIDWER